MIRQAFLTTEAKKSDLEIKAGEDAELSPLERSILRAVTYADVFDFPLTAEEIQRNLVSYVATEGEVQHALNGQQLVPDYLENHNRYFTLPGRRQIIEQRRLRSDANAALWERADYYGQLIAQLPFVRMVAVTGALAVNNARPGDDIDYLIVTEPGRLWLCRAFVILLVKRAAEQGDLICPNYFLSERALALPERDLFTAHELLQMVPVAGFRVYQRMLALNDWACGLLPTALPKLEADNNEFQKDGPDSGLLEKILRLRPADLLERWEMKRKISRFNEQKARSWPYSSEQSNYNLSRSDIDKDHVDLIELSFSADRCKGHFDLHGQNTLNSYETQLYLMDREQ